MRNIITVLVATVWIGGFEFFRNEFLLRSFWVTHYKDLGLSFPSDSIHGAMWGLWSFSFALLVFFLAKRFSLSETSAIAWFSGFVLMWIVTGTLGVLPISILPYAIPLSILESIIASLIIKTYAERK